MQLSCIVGDRIMSIQWACGVLFCRAVGSRPGGCLKMWDGEVVMVFHTLEGLRAALIKVACWSAQHGECSAGQRN
jgi:hypothetical protein